MHLPYTTVDVFTTTRYLGNPLAIVRVPATLREYLTEAQKQTIAREFNFSETVFLHDVQDGDDFAVYDIFTTGARLSFAGHPTIGTAIYLSQNADKYANVKKLKTIAGMIDLVFDAEKGTAQVSIPHDVHEHEKKFPHPLEGGESGTVPLFSIVKGMAFNLIPVSSTEVLGKAKDQVIPYDDSDDASHLEHLDAGSGWDCGLIGSMYYCELGADPEDAERKLMRTRMFAHIEDPGTGSASCALCAYLALKEDASKGEGPFKYHLVQGVEMGRRCDIFVDVRRTNDGKAIEEVKMSGASVNVTEGVITVADE